MPEHVNVPVDVADFFHRKASWRPAIQLGTDPRIYGGSASLPDAPGSNATDVLRLGKDFGRFLKLTDSVIGLTGSTIFK